MAGAQYLCCVLRAHTGGGGGRWSLHRLYSLPTKLVFAFDIKLTAADLSIPPGKSGFVEREEMAELVKAIFEWKLIQLCISSLMPHIVTSKYKLDSFRASVGVIRQGPHVYLLHLSVVSSTALVPFGTQSSSSTALVQATELPKRKLEQDEGRIMKIALIAFKRISCANPYSHRMCNALRSGARLCSCSIIVLAKAERKRVELSASVSANLTPTRRTPP